MTTSVTISARFNGPPTTGNGGYSAGLLGTLVGSSAEVTLRKPPPLDRALTIETTGAGDETRWQLRDHDTLIAEAKRAEPVLSIPPPITYAEARAAEAAYLGFTWHHFPTCFVCGPARAQGDGLRLFTGRFADRELVASSWVPDASICTETGTVEPAIVWSALDCPSYFAGRMMGFGLNAVLGRMTTTLHAPVRCGEQYVVTAWPIGRDGRKWEGGSAIFDAQGQLCACARGLWIELKD